MSVRVTEAIESIEEGKAPRFVLVWLLLLVLLCLLILLPETTAGRSVLTIFTGSVLMAAVWAARVRGRFVRAVNSIVLIAIVIATLALILGDDSSTTPNAIVMTVFTMAMPVAIVFGLRDERTVNIQTVFGAISLYFMLGMFFAFLITTVGRLDDAAYFAQGGDGSLSQRVYFSFVDPGHPRLRRPHARHQRGTAAVGAGDDHGQPVPGDRRQPGRDPARLRAPTPPQTPKPPRVNNGAWHRYSPPTLAGE